MSCCKSVLVNISYHISRRSFLRDSLRPIVNEFIVTAVTHGRRWLIFVEAVDMETFGLFFKIRDKTATETLSHYDIDRFGINGIHPRSES